MITGERLGKTYVINGTSVDLAEFNPAISTDIYYEVVRVIDGKVLFLEDHLIRLQRSISGTGIPFPGKARIVKSLKLLLDSNDFKVGNIRICLQKEQTNSPDLICYFVPYFYPESAVYLSGVQLVTYPHTRPNPGIKKWDNQFRASVNEYIRNLRVYEALLLNKQNQITEGSRSNLFFIDRDSQLITPPEKDILPGITRKYLIRICHHKGIDIIERPILLTEIDQFESCLITGTSPKILPVCQVDSILFKADHPILKLLMAEFETIIEDNLTRLERDF